MDQIDPASLLPWAAVQALMEASQPPDQPERLPSRVCRAAVAVVGAGGGSLSLSTGTATHHVLCATDDVSTRFEALQEVHGRGPGVQAYQQGAAVHLDTRAPDEDWAGLTAVVVRAVGDLCLDAVPIHVGLEVVGVLTFFRTSEGSLLVGPDALQLVADLVGDVLIADPVNRELVLAHPSWGSRSRVDLAAGMVAVQMGRGTVDGAYALLRAHSYAQEQSLPTTARQVLDGLLSFADGG